MRSSLLSRNLSVILLPAVVWLFFNATVNRHIHVLADGNVIMHAHPFEKDQAGSNPLNPHRHTEKGLMLLSLFNGFFFTILSLMVIRSYLNTCPQRLSFRLTHKEPAKRYFQVYHYHAPPIAS